MSDTVKTITPLEGFEPRDPWVRVNFDKGSRTAKRWQDTGVLVVRYFGRDPYVDVEATARRARGEKPARRKPT